MLKNWTLPSQLIIFLDFWAKILKIAHSVNYSHLPPCTHFILKLPTWLHVVSATVQPGFVTWNSHPQISAKSSKSNMPGLHNYNSKDVGSVLWMTSYRNRDKDYLFINMIYFSKTQFTITWELKKNVNHTSKNIAWGQMKSDVLAKSCLYHRVNNKCKKSKY